MRNWKRLAVVGSVIVLLLAVAVVALALEPSAPAATDLTWHVIASGGQTMSSGSYSVLSTVGQPVTGPSASDNYNVLSGYWYGIQEFLRNIFLPIVVDMQ